MHTTVMMAHPSRSEYAGKPLLIVVLGPTAVGKTAVAIQLAQRFGCDIVSADSRQVFRQLNVGVARPSDEELHAVKHHLVAHRNVWERYSCGQYAEEAKAVLARLFTSKRTAILTGGSMLYISALCNGIEDFPTPDPALRARTAPPRWGGRARNAARNARSQGIRIARHTQRRTGPTRAGNHDTNRTPLQRMAIPHHPHPAV